MAGKFKHLAFIWIVVACLGITAPTEAPPTITVPTEAPTITVPTEAPTITVPTEAPTITVPTEAPTITVPTEAPPTITVPTEAPTITVPTEAPTITVPTEAPTITVPTEAPTITVPTEAPTITVPTETPTITVPTETPTITVPTETPTIPTSSGATGTSATTAPPTTPKPGPCASDPCGKDVACEDRHGDTYECVCLSGYLFNYTRGLCEKAKIFPTTVTSEKPFVDGMSDPTTQVFSETASEIIGELREHMTGASNITVRKIEKNDASRSKTVTIKATVDIIYDEQSNVTEEEVQNQLDDATCDSCTLGGGALEDLCEGSKECDMDTTECAVKDGFLTCPCKHKYVKTNFSNRLCVACPKGQYTTDSVKCENCPFGRTGFDCSEYWQLALVIVSCVLGAMLLLTLVFLSLTTRSAKKKSKKAQSAATEKPYFSHPPTKSALSNGIEPKRYTTSSNLAVPEIPRATVQSSWNGRNNLEMSSRNNRQNSPHIYEELDDRNPYARLQRRPYDDYEEINPHAANGRSNPYGPSRPQTNPYTGNRGHTNPHFVNDNY